MTSRVVVLSFINGFMIWFFLLFGYFVVFLVLGFWFLLGCFFVETIFAKKEADVSRKFSTVFPVRPAITTAPECYQPITAVEKSFTGESNRFRRYRVRRW